MRVKTPWIDALTKSREEAAKAGKEAAPAPSIKPDLTPKKMSDSYYRAVCINTGSEMPVLILRTDSAPSSR